MRASPLLLASAWIVTQFFTFVSHYTLWRYLYILRVCACACVFPHNTLWHYRCVCVCVCVCVYSSSLSEMISRPRRVLVSTSAPCARNKQAAASKHRHCHQGLSPATKLPDEIKTAVMSAPKMASTLYARLVSLEGLDHAQLFFQSLGVGESAYPDVWWSLEYAPPRVVIDL